MSGARGSGPKQRAHMPQDVTPEVGRFDQFASAAAILASKAWFFAACLALVVVWAPSIVLFSSVDTWQLIINTVTTIVTFLLVALFQNTVTRQDEAVQDKLNALAKALADIMKKLEPDMRDDIAELRDAVGLEDRESV
jgi:low affinity Fe/Cu permease